MMKVLREYEYVSGQLINLSKSFVYLHEKVPIPDCSRIRKLTGIGQGSFPFTYLGCPIFYGRRRSDHFEELLKKVRKRILLWQNKLLSFGGRYILVAHVLQSMPVYLLTAMNPPKGIIKQLHMIFARFFWSNTAGTRSKHWVAWEDLCSPKEEGGLGFRSLHDLSNALFAKLWWNFRVSTDSLWSAFMWNKYCKKVHPIMAKSLGGSHSWRKMVMSREEVEHNIWWQTINGSSSFWYDNWTKLGALYYIEGDNAKEEEIEVKEFIHNGSWDKHKLLNHISEEITECIIDNVKPELIEGRNDKAWWMLENNGEFSVKAAWEGLRNKKEKRRDFEFIWDPKMPFKLCFFLWRVWKRRVATDDNLQRMNIHIVSKCWCCDESKHETMTHLFLTASIANRLWKQFAICAGINIEGMLLQQLITKWWTKDANIKLMAIQKAVPAMILWALWRRRNTIKHGGKCSYNQMKEQIRVQIHLFIKLKYPWIQTIPTEWQDIVKYLNEYKPKLYAMSVRWVPPPRNKIKVNTDGACRGNPGQSAYGFCIRDECGNLLYAQGEDIGLRTNTEAEIIAILEALRYCKRVGLEGFWLESDSLSIVNCLRNSWKVPWERVEQVEECRVLMEITKVRIQHTLREGNNLADFIANVVIGAVGLVQFNTFISLPTKGKCILNMDKAQVPSLRIRTRPIKNRATAYTEE
ncbi:hypothetical protein KY284_015195 [Solanum tuberosum]|nr:hypothetical protein KY284_015195 [Solanum tuberosum]